MKITKKLLSLLLAAVMLISALPLSSADFLLSDIAFAEKREILDSGEMNENISWKLYSDGELVISGQGDMPVGSEVFESENPDEFYWLKHRDIITSVTVEEGITSVGALMFLYNATKVTLPESLASISSFALTYMINLKEINIPSTVKDIGLYSFYMCLSLESLVLPEGLETMNFPFSGCISLKELIIPGSVKKFSMRFLIGCFSLEKLVLSEGTDLIINDEIWGYTPEYLGYDKATTNRIIREEWEEASELLINLKYLEIPSSVTTEGTVSVYPLVEKIYNHSDSLAIIPADDFVLNESQANAKKMEDNLQYLYYLSGIIEEFENNEMIKKFNININDFFGNKFGFNIPSVIYQFNTPVAYDYNECIKAFSFMAETELNSITKAFQILGNSIDEDSPPPYLLPSGNTMIYCYEDSYQHEYIKATAQTTHYRHTLFETEEECTEELVFEKTYEATDECGEFSYKVDVNSKTLYLSGNGIMPFWSEELVPGYIHCRHLFNKIVFTEDSNITDITNGSFMGIKDTEVILPSSLSLNGFYEYTFTGHSGTTLHITKDCNIRINCIDPNAENFKEYIVDEGHKYYFSYDGAIYAYPNTVAFIHNELIDGITLLRAPQEKTEVEIYEKTTDILPYAFTGSMIEEITIPDTVTDLYYSNFYCCPNLKEINIGKNSNLSLNQFILPLSLCCPVEKINVDNENPYLTSDENGVLYTKDKSVLIQFPSVKKAEEYIIPEGVSVINTQAFFSNERLKSVTISEDVQKIEESAFTDMYSLQKITFLNPETEIYDQYTIPKYTVIYGYKGSTAEEFALTYNRTFVEISGCVHTGGEATCENRAVCEKCGEEYGEFASHVEETYKEEESCTVNGYILTYCAVCGEDLDFEVIEAKHLWSEEYTEVTPATCTQEGLEKRTCGRCTEEETREIPKKDHDFEEAWTIDTEASCTEKGSESRHCKNCEAFTDQREIPATEHDFGEWQTVKEPTYTEEGKKERICSLCSTPETDTIPVLTTKEYKNEESGIIIEAGKDSYGGNDIKVSVKETFDGEHYLGQSFGKTAAWDISIYIDEEEVQPSTPVYVKIPVPEDFNEKKITVYHINSLTGEREKVPCEVIDGFVCFYASSFSVYIIVDESTLIEDDITDDDITNNCGHLCHKDGFLGFIWKIIKFFSKLFNANPVCECGAAHY